MKRRFSVCALLGTAVAGVWGSVVRADAVSIYDYHPVGSFTLPSANSVYSALPTGNLVVLTGSQVSIQNSVDGSTYTSQGSIPATTATGSFTPGSFPSFIAAAPGGSQVAAGDGNGDIAVFSPSNPSAAVIYTVPNAAPYDDYAAKWFNSTELAITDANGVDLLNTANHTVTTIIGDIGGASAGVAFDATGNLYTGDGYYYGGINQPGLAPGANQTGLIKVFSAASWQAALLPAANPLDFEATGTTVAQILSADSLGFDNSGNFYVGGADSYGSTGDYGYDTLVSASDIANAAASQQSSVITATPSVDVRDVTDPYDNPVNNGDPGYWTYDGANGELYLQYSDPGDATVQVFSAVPEPGSMAMLCLGACSALLGRRRGKSVA
jgi:hypothetical protein